MPKKIAIRPIEDGVTLSWLAGLLEGEGSFMMTGSSGIAIGLQMTDKDVVHRVASVTNAKVHRIEPREAHHKPVFALLVRGQRAAYYMEKLLPFMGGRRSEAIRKCLAWATESRQRKVARAKQLTEKVSDADFLAAWHARPACSLRAFASSIGLHHSSVARRLNILLASPTPAALPCAFDETAWAAGLLEGEGSFRGAREPKPGVWLGMTDEDVVHRFSGMFGSAVHRYVQHDKPHWKPQFKTFVGGRKGVRLMADILPLLGNRRAETVRACLETFRSAEELALREAAALIDAWRARGPNESIAGVARRLDIKPDVLRCRLAHLGEYAPTRKSPSSYGRWKKASNIETTTCP